MGCVNRHCKLAVNNFFFSFFDNFFCLFCSFMVFFLKKIYKYFYVFFFHLSHFFITQNPHQEILTNITRCLSTFPKKYYSNFIKKRKMENQMLSLSLSLSLLFSVSVNCGESSLICVFFQQFLALENSDMRVR